MVVAPVAFLVSSAVTAGVLLLGRVRRHGAVGASLNARPLVHYTNNLCPFSHRAMFARALCPISPEPTTVHVPYGREVDFAAAFGGDTWQHTTLGKKALERGSDQYKGSLRTDLPSRTEALKALKKEYMKDINPNGEVPAICLPSGHIIIESDVVMEYYSAASKARGGRSLVPDDPELLVRMRQAITRCNEITPHLFKLLRNQDPAADEELKVALATAVSRFVSALDSSGGYCIASRCTLADVHCAPLLYRLGDVGMRYWRGFSVRSVDPRVGELLDTITALPEWQSGVASDEEIVANYELPAHGGKWAADGKSFAGRGRS